MYSPSISPIRRLRNAVHRKNHQTPESMDASFLDNNNSTSSNSLSPFYGGDLEYLKKSVNGQRLLVQSARSELAANLDRLGEHHVRCRQYDDAMDAFTEALHEKRSVFSQLAPTVGGSLIISSSSKAKDGDLSLLTASPEKQHLLETSVDQRECVDPQIKQLHDSTLDEIVQTLKSMGNVHSLRGEQDEAMRYYSEVTALRRRSRALANANNASVSGMTDEGSVSTQTKSGISGFWGDEDNSTLMSEINEDVKALDDLFRGISFRNDESSNGSPNGGRRRRNSSTLSSSSFNRNSTERKKKRSRGLRENGAENDPFQRASSMGLDNELTEALEAYRNVVALCEDSSRFEKLDETLNSFTLRANLLHENMPKSSSSSSSNNNNKNNNQSSSPERVPEGHPTRVAELQLALEVYTQVLSVQQDRRMDPIQDMDSEPQASANIASTMIRMGSLNYKLNQVEKELMLYQEAKKVYANAFGENHQYVAGTCKNIGMVLAERGEYDEAMAQFETARQIYLSISSQDEDPVVSNCGMMSMSTTTAEPQHSVHSCQRDVASAISCMGNVKNRMGELEDALKHYMEALQMYKQLAKNADLSQAERELYTKDVTTTLKVIGMVRTKRGELDEAMEFYSEALGLLRTSGLLENRGGKETLASVLARIAGIHFKKGEYDEAMSQYKEAHDLTVHLRGLNHPEVAGILHYIGGIHHKRGDYSDAMDCYQEAVRVYHSTLGPGHSAVAATLVCIGSIHYKKRNLDAAMMFYREAFRLNRDAYGLHHPDVAPTLKSIGTILTKKGEYDEAYDAFRDVLSIKCTLHGTHHPEVANAYKSLGNVHYKRGELADAERQYRHALNIYRRTKGEDHPDTISARTSIEHIRYWMRERGSNNKSPSGTESDPSTPSAGSI